MTGSLNRSCQRAKGNYKTSQVPSGIGLEATHYLLSQVAAQILTKHYDLETPKQDAWYYLGLTHGRHAPLERSN